MTQTNTTRSPRSFVASLAVAAVLAGTGGVAIGHAWGEQPGAQAPSATSSQGYGLWQGGSVPGGPSAGGSSQGHVPDPWSGWGFGGAPGTGGGSAGATGSTTTRAATALEVDGLVRISTRNVYDGTAAAGTGMVLTSDGEVLTNHHVVQGATTITATVLATGQRYTATVVGTDATADVAVLRLQDAHDLDTVSTATTPAALDDTVTAVGDAGGSSASFTAAPGTVSALEQSITTQAEGAVPAEHLTGLMELTSDVAAGDSGGPTYDAAGDVVGMTTAASAGGPTIDGYAVPIARALDVAGDLAAHRAGADYAYGRAAFLGVALAAGRGTVVQQVYDATPAATAGLTAGDRITAVDGRGVRTLAGLRRAVASHQPGESVRVTWVRAGSTRTADLTLATGPVA
ncbi:MAG: S1C family serine protease [Marmoricola sp.]